MRLSITCWEDDASQIRREEQQDAPTADELIEVPCVRCGDWTTMLNGEDQAVCEFCVWWESRP